MLQTLSSECQLQVLDPRLLWTLNLPYRWHPSIYGMEAESFVNKLPGRAAPKEFILLPWLRILIELQSENIRSVDKIKQ